MRFYIDEEGINIDGIDVGDSFCSITQHTLTFDDFSKFGADLVREMEWSVQDSTKNSSNA